MTDLDLAIKAAGVSKIAAACGISQRAVYKWLKKGCLPKTEFYGKTHYAETIEQLTAGQFIAEALLEESRQKLLSG